MPQKAERRGAGAVKAEPPAAPHAFEEVRNTLVRAAADSQSNEVTEKILNKFLTTAAILTAERCSGRLAVEAILPVLLSLACILDAPIGFLDCILFAPWTDKEAFLILSGSDGSVDEDAARRHYINLPLQSYLLEPMLDFVYSKQFCHVLPPMMRPSSRADQVGPHLVPETRTFVAAAFDGGTPLHVAAASGRNQHVTWLLAAGADLRKRTAAGDLPIQLVPKCDEPHVLGSRARECNCAVAGGSDPSECCSQRTRERMAWHTFRDFSAGAWAWLLLLLASLACVFGLDGCHKTFLRREIGAHADTIRQAKQRAARQLVREQIQAMRISAEESQRLVNAAVACDGPLATRFDIGEPGGDKALTGSWQGHTESTEHSSQSPPPELRGKVSQCTAAEPCSPRPAVDVKLLLQSSLDTVHTLQDFGVKSIQVKSSGSWMDLPRQLEEQRALQQTRSTVPPDLDLDLSDCQIRPREQAAIFLCLAQAVFLCHKLQGYPEDGSKLAGSRIGIAHDNSRLLLGRVERHPERYEGELSAVGTAFSRVLHVHACMALSMLARRSATPTAVATAEQLLSRWKEMTQRGFVKDCGLTGDVSVECLDGWCRTAAADLAIAEALKGQSLRPDEQLSGVIEASVLRPGREWQLTRTASTESLKRLKEALHQHSDSASAFISAIASSALATATREAAAAEALQDLTTARIATTGARPYIRQLEAAIEQAEGFNRLEAEVTAARQIRARWEAKAIALERLEAEIASAKAPCITQPTDQAPAEWPGEVGSIWHELQGRHEGLQAAIEEASKAEVSVTTAKKVLNEIRAQLAAGEMATKLQALLSSRAGGSTALRAAVQRAESTATGAGVSSLSGHTEGSQALAPLLHAARRQVDVERSTELLQRAVATCHSLADLPKLEAAILSARKTGDVAAEILRSASELRGTLDRATRTKAALDTGVRTLSRSRRPEDVAQVEAVIAGCDSEKHLLGEEVKAAEDAIAAWEAATAAEARLRRALSDGSGTAVLARALQDAIAVDVPDIGEAQRVLKAMSNLEAAMQRAQEGQAGNHVLRDRIAAAEQAGVREPLLSAARALESKLQLSEAKCELELALKPRADRSMAVRAGALNAAVQAAEALLPPDSNAATTESEPLDVPEDGELTALQQSLQQRIEEARSKLAEEAREQERIDHSRAEELLARQEKVRAGQKERERERQARIEQARLERERQSQERLLKREAERIATEIQTASNEVAENGHGSKPPEDRLPAPHEAASDPGKAVQLARPRPTAKSLPVLKCTTPEPASGVGKDGVIHVTCSSPAYGSLEDPPIAAEPCGSAHASSDLGSAKHPSPPGSTAASESSTATRRTSLGWDPLFGVPKNSARPAEQELIGQQENGLSKASFENVDTPESRRPTEDDSGLRILTPVAWRGPPPKRLMVGKDAPVVEIRRPCSYDQNGSCRNGETCRFAHAIPPSRFSPPPQPLSPSRRLTIPTSASGAGALAFGAPGLVAFSSGMRARDDRNSLLSPGAGLQQEGFGTIPQLPHPLSLRPGLKSLDLAAGGIQSPAPQSFLPRSESANKADALLLTEQASGMGSPFPGVHQWTGSGEVTPQQSSSPRLANLNGLSRLEGRRPDLETVLQDTLSSFDDFTHHGRRPGST